MELLERYSKDITDMIHEVSFLLKDTLQERYRYPRIIPAILDALVDFYLRTQMVKQEVNVQLLANNTEYNIKALVENDPDMPYFGFPIRIGYDGDSVAGIAPTSLFAIDMKGYRRDETMAPQGWYLCAMSPGKIQILGSPPEDGETLPSEIGNLQVTYIGLPKDFDDFPNVPAQFHQYVPYGAAALILEDGDKEDLALADVYQGVFDDAILEVVGEEYRSQTVYDNMRPL